MKTIVERTKFGKGDLITLLVLESIFIYFIFVSRNDFGFAHFCLWTMLLVNGFVLLRPKTLSITIDDENIIIKKNRGFFKLAVSTDIIEIDKIKIISITGGPINRYNRYSVEFTDLNNINSDIEFVVFQNRIDTVNAIKNILEKQNVSIRLVTDIYDPQSEYFKTLIFNKYSLTHDKFKTIIHFNKGKYLYFDLHR